MPRTGKNPSKKNKTTFQKKHTAGKNRAELDREERLGRSLSRGMLSRLYNIYIWSTPKELDDYLANPNLSAFERQVCLSIRDNCNTGDIATIEYFVSRLLGKMAETVVLEESDSFKGLTLDQMREEHARLAKINKVTFDNILNKDEKMKELEANYRRLAVKPDNSGS